jgi:hypothetical protein
MYFINISLFLFKIIFVILIILICQMIWIKMKGVSNAVNTLQPYRKKNTIGKINDEFERTHFIP